jgi:transcriptional regulator with XRE-family HTH domain
MTAAEKILALCKERKIAVSKLERELGFANGYIKGAKDGKISAERVMKIGDYFGVPYHEIDEETFDKDKSVYYIDRETASLAQVLFDNPDLRILMDAARGVAPKDLRLVAQMLERFKETNPDG